VPIVSAHFRFLCFNGVLNAVISYHLLHMKRQNVNYLTLLDNDSSFQQKCLNFETGLLNLK